MEDPRDSSETREAEPGAEFWVELSRSGGTGYRWEVSHAAEGIRVISEAPSSGSAHNGETMATPPTPGSPVVQRFVVQASASGVIAFRLRRPWEQLAVRTHTLYIRMRKEPTG